MNIGLKKKLLTQIKLPVALCGLLASVLVLGHSPKVFAVGTMYFSPSSTTLSSGSEVALALRINPGATIEGVQAEIGYDASKLQMLSLSDEGTAFPDIAEQNAQDNPITLTRTTSSGVNSDALIVTLRFRALASSGSTSLTLKGNAGTASDATNPATQGATINFNSPQGGPAPSPASPSPSSPGGSSSSQQHGNSSVTPSSPTDTTNPTNQSPDGAEDEAFLIPPPAKKRPAWLLPIVAVLIAGIVAGGIWLMRHRADTAADIAAEHPIDTTWATTRVQTPKSTQTEQLLQQSPGLPPPDPGSVIAPKPKDNGQNQPPPA